MEFTNADIGRKCLIDGEPGYHTLVHIDEDTLILVSREYPNGIRVSKDKVTIPDTYTVSSYCSHCGRGAGEEQEITN